MNAKTLKWLGVLILAGLVLSSLLLANPLSVRSVYATSVSHLDLPFDPGVEWKVVNGYNDGAYHGSAGYYYAKYALDLQKVSGSPDTQGSNVRLPVDVFWFRYDKGLRPGGSHKCANFAIDTWPDGRYLYLEICHVDFAENLEAAYDFYGKLPKGLIIGTVANAGSCGDGSCDTAHIHIAAHVSPAQNPWGSPRDPIEFDNHNGFDLSLGGKYFPSSGPGYPWDERRDLYAYYPDGVPNYLSANTCLGQAYNVVLWENVNFTGYCIGLNDVGSTYNIPEGFGVSSIYLSPNWKADHILVIYDNYNSSFIVRFSILKSSVTDLVKFLDWNDKVKSIHNSYTGLSWLQEFSIADHPPLSTDIHVKVNYQTGFDAMRVCFNGENCQETAATELYYTWPVYLEQSGDYAISVQYRTLSDNQNWANADEATYGYHLVVHPEYTSCSANVDGVTLTSGQDCVKVTQTIRDLAPAGWADRSATYGSVSGNIEAWFYDSVDYQGAPKVLKSGQTGWIGGNLSSIEVKPLAAEPPPVPTLPFVADNSTVHLWHFDENANPIVYDSAGGLYGTISSGSWTASDIAPAFGWNLQFTNPNDGRGVTFNPMDVCPMTFEAWVKTGEGGRLAGQLGGGGNSGNHKWLLYMQGDKPKLEIWFTNGSQSVTSYKSTTDGNWHYLMWTYDCGTAVKLYVDNELVGSLTLAYQWNSGATTFEVGASEGIGKCNCKIDEIRISNIARIPTAPEATPTPTVTPTATPTPTPTPVEVVVNSFETGEEDWWHSSGNESTGETQSDLHPTNGTKSLALVFNHVSDRALYQRTLSGPEDWSQYQTIKFDIWSDQDVYVALALGSGPDWTWDETYAVPVDKYGDTIYFDLSSDFGSSGVTLQDQVRYIDLIIYPSVAGTGQVYVDNIRLEGTVVAPTPTPTPSPTLTPTPTQVAGDSSTFNFEDGTIQNWMRAENITALDNTTAMAYLGTHSVCATANFGGGGWNGGYAFVDRNVSANETITARVYLPAGAPDIGSSMYLQNNNWGWFESSWTTLTPGAWTTLTWNLSGLGFTTPTYRIGLHIGSSNAYQGCIYIDSIDVIQ